MLFGESTSEAEAFELMDVAYDHGITLFDTAEMYPVPQSAQTQGQSEIILGKWLKNKPRHERCTFGQPAGSISVHLQR